jgi:hypothetical protein
MGFHLPIGLLGNLFVVFALGIDSVSPFLAQTQFNEKTRTCADELAAAFHLGLLLILQDRNPEGFLVCN